jgi:cell division protein FtsI/penicillin-binding protein 2
LGLDQEPKTGSGEEEPKTATAEEITPAAETAPASAEATADKPAEKPKIAVLILVENALEGSLNAVPIAKDVLNWYYWNRINRI